MDIRHKAVPSFRTTSEHSRYRGAQSNLDAATARKIAGSLESSLRIRTSALPKQSNMQAKRTNVLLRLYNPLKLHGEMLNAGLEIASANERAANAEKESARISGEAEEERLARAKIEEKLAWRALTGNSRAESLASSTRSWDKIRDS